MVQDAGPFPSPLFERTSSRLDPFREAFDHVYVITVESRRRRVEALLESLDFDSSFASIIPAVVKPSAEKADWDRVRAGGDFDPETLSMLTAGEVAVSLSQRKVLAHFLKGVDEVVLILEDDFAVNGFGVRERLEQSARYLVNGAWDALFLGRCHDTCDQDVLLGGDLYRVFAPACLHAYAVTKKGARIILQAASACKGANCPIDNIVRSAVKAGKLRATAISPQLFTQDASFRGRGSLVGASDADIDRMVSTGEHLKHALRRGENTEDDAGRDAKSAPRPRKPPECKAWSERLLISNVNAFADRHAVRPRKNGLGDRMSVHRSHGAEHRPLEEQWDGVTSAPLEEEWDGVTSAEGGDQHPNRSLQDADAAGGGDGGAEGAMLESNYRLPLLLTLTGCAAIWWCK